MKKYFFLLVSIVFVMACNSNNKPPKVETEKAEVNKSMDKMLVGNIELNELQEAPFKEWFDKAFNTYKVDSATINELHLSGLEVEVVFGTWCGDSQREVPRFAKIAQTAGFDNVKFVAVDRTKNAEGTNVKDLNIERVPTFIVFRDSVELGRIVESPKTSLEMDLYNILNK